MSTRHWHPQPSSGPVTIDRPTKGPTMALPDLVLVHGGEHAGDCWDLVVAELRCLEPELRTLAVDLPGRGRTPGNLATATIGEWVDSVVADIERNGSGDIVIVGHSMAGVTVPGVVANRLRTGPRDGSRQRVRPAARTGDRRHPGRSAGDLRTICRATRQTVQGSHAWPHNMLFATA